HRHRQKALARTGDTDPKYQIVISDRVQILPLIGRLWGDRLLARRVKAVEGKMVPQAIGPILGDLFECILQLLVRKGLPLVKKLAKIAKYCLDRGDIPRVTVEQ